MLDVVPRKRQLEVKVKLEALATAESSAACERRKAEFRRAYARVFPKAVDRLERDRERMVA